MRGPSNALPKYAKHRASGKAVVRLNGQDFYLGNYGTKASKIEYERLIGEWLANGRQIPTIVETKPLSIMKLCSQYWVFAQGYYVKYGKQTDELASVKAAMRYLKQAYGKTAAKDFGPLALEAVRNKMIEAGSETAEASPRWQQTYDFWAIAAKGSSKISGFSEALSSPESSANRLTYRSSPHSAKW